MTWSEKYIEVKQDVTNLRQEIKQDILHLDGKIDSAKWIGINIFFAVLVGTLGIAFTIAYVK